MKAVCWYGAQDVRVENVPEPKILDYGDAIIKITLSAICGSDLHLYDGCIPTMKRGDILGHEFMGEVVEAGSEVKKLKKGDRVVVPFTICCGQCFYCQRDMWSLCDNSNPNAGMAEKMYGSSGAGLFGYSHLFGGFAGGQAQYARVPFADVGPLRITAKDLRDEQLLFLSDIFPTGYMAAENCNLRPGDTVAVWGCGPVGQFAIRSAFLLGAEKVIALDRSPARLQLADKANAQVLNFDDVDVVERLRDLTGGRGPDACIDAVGMEAHTTSLIDAFSDRAKHAMKLETDHPHVLRQAIQSCRKGGTVSIPGVYGGFMDKFPIGAAFAKGLTLRMGQTHVPKYMGKLLELIEQERIDPSEIISHRAGIDGVPEMYKVLRDQKDNCIKVVLSPN